MSAKRAALRRMEKQKEKEQTATEKTHDRYLEGYENGFEDGYLNGMAYGIAETVRVCVTAFVATIKKEFEFGKIRLDRLLHDVLNTFNYYKEKPDEEQRQRLWIQKNMGIDLDEYTGCNKLDTMREYIPKTHGSNVFKEKFDSHRVIGRGSTVGAVNSVYKNRAKNDQLQ